jgi:glycosyltransferase involved in cell wall biosynthesis
VIDVILPCLDEVQALPWVLGRIPDGARPIVVDNGSSDGSADLARSLGATVVDCSVRGYGAASHAGLIAATADLVAFCDCDGSMDPAVLSDFAAIVLAGDADLVVARRRPAQRGAWPVHARLANQALTWVLRRRAGIELHDIGPMRLARRIDLLALSQADRRNGYPLETVLLAARAGWRLVERDIAYLPRSGRSKVTGTVRGTLRAVRDMSAVLAR